MRLAKRLGVELSSSPGISSASVTRRVGANERKIWREALPELIEVMALLAASGLSVLVILQWLTPRLTGPIALRFQNLLSNVELGADLVTELEALEGNLQLPAFTELSEKLILGLMRGNPISEQLAKLAESAAAEQARELLKLAGSKESKMLIPTVFLILPITVLFALFPSVSMLQKGF